MDSQKIKKIISEMSLVEKAKICVGKDFWHTFEIERLGVKATMLTDGPHGLRKQEETADHLGLGESKTAICFPAGCTLASSFDPKLSELLGTELGKLAQAENVSTVLGPAMNIKRSPLCGRNFEYYSEDPYLTAHIAAGTVEGIQSQSVAACPKHFLANNQEYYRLTSNSVVEEQTLREIYLSAFEYVVKKAKPWTMMCSYNRINGTYACQNKLFLTDILRDEWGFDGYVMTDWGACDDPVESQKAGLNLIMPGPAPENVNRIIRAVNDGKMEESVLDQSVQRILAIAFRYMEHHKNETEYDFEKGHEIAKIIAQESAVLLKNENRVLPLANNEKVAFIGKYVKTPRYQGGGSSHVNAYKVKGAWEYLHDKANILYAEGVEELEDEVAVKEAVKIAEKSDKAVIFAGLPDSFETEGVDRSNLKLPECQNELIRQIVAVQPNTIVVLHNGSPIEMPWINEVKAVLEIYLGGEAVGEATVDLLYGAVNPSGHLAETFPLAIEDTPCYPYYGIEKDDVRYREEMMVGYRYYTTKQQNVLFPFGHGLSYTNFTYSNLILNKKKIEDVEQLWVSVDIKNSGAIIGKEVVQLYVSPNIRDVVYPIRELKGFKKVELLPGETKTVTFLLEKPAFAHWNVKLHDWVAETAVYDILIGKSVEDICLSESVRIISTTKWKECYSINTPMGDIIRNPKAYKKLSKLLEPLMNMVSQNRDDENPGKDIMTKEALEAMTTAMPIRAILSFGADITIEKLEQLIDEVNNEVN